MANGKNVFCVFWKNEKYICDNISKENMEKYEQYDMLKENIWFSDMTPLGFLLGTKKIQFLTLWVGNASNIFF